MTQDSSEETTYIGNEFLTWLLFKTDCFDGNLHLADLGEINLLFTDSIRLEDREEMPPSPRIDIKMVNAAYSPECKTALFIGRQVFKAKLQYTDNDNRVWDFTLTGETMNFSGIKVPSELDKNDEMAFDERMNLLEQLEEVIDILYQEFIKIRISDSWNSVLIPAMHKYIRNNEKALPADYPRQLLEFEKGSAKTTFKNNNALYEPLSVNE